MHARKIALHRNSIIALVMTLLVIGSVLAIAGNSTAISPQEGKVTYTASYLSTNGNNIPAIGAKVTVSTLSGYQVATLNGVTNYTSLPLGSYVFTLQPYETSGATYIVNETSKMVNVTSTAPVSINLKTTAYLTHEVNVTVSGINSGNSATVSFSTLNGFVFKTVTTTGNFEAALPSGDFYATVTYGGQSNTALLTAVGTTQTLYTAGTSQIYSGIVTNQNGQAMQHFNVVAIDNTAGAQKYTVTPFTAGSFQFVGSSTTQYVITANGYQPMNYNSANVVYPMVKAHSNVTYNYTLGSNPADLSLTVTYNIGNSTALPFMPNATLGSFYWQNKFDTLTSAAHLAFIRAYVDGLVGNYTNYAILVNGHNYKQTSTTVVTPATVNSTGTGLSAEVTYTFQNNNVTAASLANGFTVKLFAAGTQYTSGSLYYDYVFNYNINGLSLASPVSAANTFVSPVHLLPQTNSGWLNLVFNKVSAPFVTASEINLYWNNTTPQNYLVSSNSTSAVFLAPKNVPVHFNVSNAFFNPVTGTNDYAKALNWKWTVNGSSPVPMANTNTYNASITFPGFAKYTVTVNFTSSSGVANETTFIVYAYNGTPSASLNVTSQGKTLLSTQAVSGVTSFSVPQSKSVLFSAYTSSLVIPGTSYKVPLLYKWYFPGYTNTGANVTQTFNTPWIAHKTFVTGYLDVSSTVGVAKNVTMSLNVTDTTPPSAVMTLQNSNHTTISQPVAGQIVIFNGSQSTDKYYGTSLNYSWSVVYSNGTKVPTGNSTYELVSGNTYQSTFVVRFNTLSSLIVSMKVTNGANVSAYKNFTTSIVVDSPRLIVQSVYFPTTPSQGASTLVYVNVSNNGTVNANSFSLVAYVNGKNVSYQSYGLLPVGVTKQFEFNLTSPTSGNVQFVFRAYNSSEPSFFATSTSNALTVSHNVNAPAYQTPLIVGVVIAVIVLIGFAYYRLSSGGSAKKPKDRKPAQKKSEEKKK